MKYKITHTTKYAYSAPASLCQNKLHLAPRVTPSQKLSRFNLVISPDPDSSSSSKDFFGNRVDYFAIAKPHPGLSITSVSHVELTPLASRSWSLAQGGDSVSSTDSSSDSIPDTPTWEEISQELREDADGEMLTHQQFLFASKFIPLNQALREFAVPSFPNGQSVLRGAMDLMRRIHSEFKYDPKATTISTPVMEVLGHRSGVCQDFAHLQIASLRSLGLAARYVSGYLRTKPPPGQDRQPGRDESHAWLSVYCGKEIGWVDLDPTNNVIPSMEHVVVGWGRDYADLCPIQGVFTGGGQSTMSVSVDLQLLRQ